MTRGWSGTCVRPSLTYDVRVTLTQNRRDDLGAPTGAETSGIESERPRRRARRTVDNEAFAAFVRRIIRAHGRRVGTGDIEGLADMHRVAVELRDEVGEAARRLVEVEGYSWADVGRVLGIKRQSAHEMYARKRSA